MTQMTKDLFLEYLGAYGADFSRWPEQVRLQAQGFLADADAETLHAFEAESQFDAVIAPLGTLPDLSVDLETRLLASAPLPRSSRRSAGLFNQILMIRAPRWISAGLASACLVGGVGVGYSAALSEQDTVTLEAALDYASLSAFEVEADWNTLLESDE